MWGVMRHTKALHHKDGTDLPKMLNFNFDGFIHEIICALYKSAKILNKQQNY